jgi:hypothetical protein
VALGGSFCPVTYGKQIVVATIWLFVMKRGGLFRGDRVEVQGDHGCDGRGECCQGSTVVCVVVNMNAESGARKDGGLVDRGAA